MAKIYQIEITEREMATGIANVCSRKGVSTVVKETTEAGQPTKRFLCFGSLKDLRSAQKFLNKPDPQLLAKLDLTPETYRLVFSVFYGVWNNIADDLFSAVGTKRVSRKDVVEMVFDADRIEQYALRYTRQNESQQKWMKEGYPKFIAHYHEPAFKELSKFLHPEPYAYNE